MKSQVYEVNAIKDPISNFLLSRWQNFFSVLFIVFFLQVLANYFSGSLAAINVDSLPPEKTVLLKDEIVLLPSLRDISFFSYHVAAVILFFPARRFLLHIPQTFKTLSTNRIFKKRKGSTQKNILIDYNESLQKFENHINGRDMYVLGFILYSLVIILYIINIRPIEELDLMLWQDIHFFPASCIVYLIVAPLMWFVVGIFVWKMYYVVSFMRKLTHEYDLVMKPFNPDGFGGFKPLGQLWMNMNFLAAPIVLYYIIIFVFFRSFNIPILTFQKYIEFFIIALYNIAIAVLLIYPLQNYHNIVESQKNELLEDIEKKIDKYYQEIEKTLMDEKKRKVDSTSMEQLKHFHEIALKVTNVPPWPFTPSERIIIVLSAAAPWIANVVNYLT